MMHLTLLITLTLIFGGVMSFLLNKSHLLNSLLSLEFMSLAIFLMMNLYFMHLNEEMYLSIYYLIMVVSESILGLSLLISMVYSSGVDLMTSINFSLC